LMGFIFPDAGEIARGDWLPQCIGFVPERPAFPPRSPADEYLMLAGQLSATGTPLRNIVTTRLHQVGLSHAARWRVNQFSKGMLQRLAIAQALISDPAFLILDEPMNGLDPAGQKEMRDLIKALRGEGKTVLFSTHRLDDIADVCTHAGILKRGRLVRAGALDAIVPLRDQIVITVNRVPTPQTISTLHPGISIDGNTLALRGDAIAYKAAVLRALLEMDADIQSLSHQRATLEEIYLEAMR
ncbi:MAG: ABC transporter ATP-binding protein, partial [Anaerolineales bacterium]|nr:ABC transporter ATP-binding protein [Anaerolineales bacterium]